MKQMERHDILHERRPKREHQLRKLSPQIGNSLEKNQPHRHT
jgi:hypothetical protein